MSLMGSKGSLSDAIEAAICEAIPGATAKVAGSGGHFDVSVVSDAFAGKTLLAKHRLVMSVLAPFMDGDNAPVHAIDNLETKTPD